MVLVLIVIKFSLYSYINEYLYKKEKNVIKTFNKNVFLTHVIKFKKINRSFDDCKNILYCTKKMHIILFIYQLINDYIM